MRNFILKLRKKLTQSSFGIIIKKVYPRLKTSSLIFPYFCDIFRNSFKTLPVNNKKIFCTLDDERLFTDSDGSGRYAYLTLNRFCRAGYTIYVHKKMNFKTYLWLGKYGRYLFFLKNLKFGKDIPKDTSQYIYLFDTAQEEMLGRQWRRRTYLNVLKTSNVRFGKMVWIPYFFHANIYKTQHDKDIYRLRNTKRKLRAMFIGNIDNAYYDGSGLKRYHQLTRLESVRALKESDLDVKCFYSALELINDIHEHEYSKKCFLTFTDHRFPINPATWFNVMSQSDFFLCLSGTDLPMCHNVIEAMAVGTIPIISYEDWFLPPVEHGKNAIVYKGKEDLIHKVKEVINMSPERILNIRREVMLYFDKYLSNERFIKEFESQGDDISTIMLHPRLITTEEEKLKEKPIVDGLYGYFKGRKLEEAPFKVKNEVGHDT